MAYSSAFNMQGLSTLLLTEAIAADNRRDYFTAKDKYERGTSLFSESLPSWKSKVTRRTAIHAASKEAGATTDVRLKQVYGERINFYQDRLRELSKHLKEMNRQSYKGYNTPNYNTLESLTRSTTPAISVPRPRLNTAEVERQRRKSFSGISPHSLSPLSPPTDSPLSSQSSAYARSPS